MKKKIALFLLLPLTAFGIERGQLDKLLAEAASKNGTAYIEARNAITNLGANALVMLAQAGTDAALPWQQRLVARIGYERIVRGTEIEALRRYNWRDQPGYDREWEKSVTGPGWKMTGLAVPQFTEVGLWYYYIELTWRKTDELALSPFHNINNNWVRWCRMALRDQPERIWLGRAMIERLECDPLLEAPDAVELYRTLKDEKESGNVPILIDRYDAFNKRSVFGPEMYQGENGIIYLNQFKQILDFTASCHADLLDKFIAERGALAPLKGKIGEVRQRPIPAPRTEPPFRLGKTLVMIP
jgi:hypothetical protein